MNRCVFVAALGLSLAASITSAQVAPVPDSIAILKDFDARVSAYLKIRRAAEGEVSALRKTASAEEIAKRQSELAVSLREHRPAKQGDIFSPEITGEFRRLVAITLKGPAATRVKKSLKSAEPVQLSLKVNDTYPERAPLQSTPPTLLMNLPKLPPELEYRVVSRALILLDVKAGILVDFIPDLIK
jgi:hypothetical protein